MISRRYAWLLMALLQYCEHRGDLLSVSSRKAACSSMSRSHRRKIPLSALHICQFRRRVVKFEDTLQIEGSGHLFSNLLEITRSRRGRYGLHLYQATRPTFEICSMNVFSRHHQHDTIQNQLPSIRNPFRADMSTSLDREKCSPKQAHFFRRSSCLWMLGTVFAHVVVNERRYRTTTKAIILKLFT